MDNPNILRRHRKRFSALHLSSDTTATLPEYTSSPPWNNTREQRHHNTQLEPVLPSDRPPDYPDSAEEGDADTSSEESVSVQTATNSLVYVPQHYSISAQSSPRRFQYRRPGSGHKRKHSNSTKVSSGRSRRGSLSGATPAGSTASEDPFLDSLLERSVHALEMSNALLQSSISTQSSLSTILASPDIHHRDNQLEARARGLSSRIRGNKEVHKNWSEDLDDIRRDVERLFEEGGKDIGSGSESDNLGLEGRHNVSAARRAHRDRRNRASVDSISSSLPASTSLTTEVIGNRPSRRRPSLDFRNSTSALHTASESLPHLRLSNQHQLISPAPRALTQYIESSEDPAFIHMPSTLGLRTGSSSHTAAGSSDSHFAQSQTVPPTMSITAASPPVETHPIYLTSSIAPPGQGSSKSASTLSLPIVTDTTPAPSTPAYNMLSSFVYRPQTNPSGSSTPSSFISTSFLTSAFSRRRSSSNTPQSSRRSVSPDHRTNRPKPLDSPPSDPSQHNIIISRSRSTTPKPVYPSSLPNPHTIQRSMTPPIEESSASSDDCAAKKTIVSLRKILDDHPSTSPPRGSPRPSARSSPSRSTRRRTPKRPKFVISPPPDVDAGTSTATASISRLYTKAKHTSSTRPPSPPRHSSLKGGSSGMNTPNPGSPGGSSGRSTPKRISFAESPDGFPGTGNSAGRLKSGSKGKGKEAPGNKSSSSKNPGWWAVWLLGGSLSDDSESGRTSRGVDHEERGRSTAAGMGVGTLTKSFGPRMGLGGAFDEWGV